MAPTSNQETPSELDYWRNIEDRFTFLEGLAAQANKHYVQIAERQDANDSDIKAIRQTVTETKTLIEAREERCENHYREIASNTKDIKVLAKHVANVECKTWPTVLKIISIYTGAMTLGGLLVLGAIKMLGDT